MMPRIALRGLCRPPSYVRAQKRWNTSASANSVPPKFEFRAWLFTSVVSVATSIATTLAALHMHSEQLAESAKTQHQKDEFQLEEAKRKLDKIIQEDTGRIFVDDIKYTPFFSGSALEIAIRMEITKKTREPGVVIVLCPKDAGKTTRMALVLRTLKEKGEIAGAFKVDPAILTKSEQSVMASLSNSVCAPPQTPFWEILPVTDKPIVVVIDNIDKMVEGPNGASVSGRMKELAHDLAMATVAPSRGVDFQVFVLTSNPKLAQTLLGINGGRKVRLLGYDKEIVGGNELYDVNTWKRQGLKLQRQDVDALVKLFETERELRLDPPTRNKLIELGVKSGTTGFVRTVCGELADSIHDNSCRLKFLSNKAGEAHKQAQEWRECAKVEKPL